MHESEKWKWSCSVMSDSSRPHRLQPTRLLRPWDSPGKNTGVGCHFLLQCRKVKSLSRVRLCATPWTVDHQAPPSMGFSRQESWNGVPLPSPWFLTYLTPNIRNALYHQTKISAVVPLVFMTCANAETCISARRVNLIQVCLVIGAFLSASLGVST